MASLSFCAAALLLVLFFQLRKRFRPAWFAALGSLVVASLLTIFDDFGWSDLVVLILNFIPIFLLVKDRAWYLQGQPGG